LHVCSDAVGPVGCALHTFACSARAVLRVSRPQASAPAGANWVRFPEPQGGRTLITFSKSLVYVHFALSQIGFVLHVFPPTPAHGRAKLGSFCTFHSRAEPRPARQLPMPIYPIMPRFGFVSHNHPTAPRAGPGACNLQPAQWLCFAYCSQRRRPAFRRRGPPQSPHGPAGGARPRIAPLQTSNCDRLVAYISDACRTFTVSQIPDSAHFLPQVLVRHSLFRGGRDLVARSNLLGHGFPACS
jgi:hypothetical protein